MFIKSTWFCKWTLLDLHLPHWLLQRIQITWKLITQQIETRKSSTEARSLPDWISHVRCKEPASAMAWWKPWVLPVPVWPYDHKQKKGHCDPQRPEKPPTLWRFVHFCPISMSSVFSIRLNLQEDSRMEQALHSKYLVRRQALLLTLHGPFSKVHLAKSHMQ